MQLLHTTLFLIFLAAKSVLILLRLDPLLFIRKKNFCEAFVNRFQMNKNISKFFRASVKIETSFLRSARYRVF